MRILIVGTGVIGSIYGWALSKKHEVYHYVREEKLSQLNHYVRNVDMIDERRNENEQQVKEKYEYRCVNQIKDYYDFIMIPTSYEQMLSVLKELKQKVNQGRYYIMASNWKGTDEIEQILKKEEYVLGYAGGGGTICKENDRETIWANIGADYMLGMLYKEQKPLYEVVKGVFAECNFIPEETENIVHKLWIHNIDSAALGAMLLKYQNMEQMLNDKKAIELCFQAMNEEFEMAGKRGVSLEHFPEVAMYQMDFETLYQMFYQNMKENPVMKRYTAHAEKSVKEMIYNLHEIYKSGKQMGYEMPLTKKILEMIDFDAKLE